MCRRGALGCWAWESNSESPMTTGTVALLVCRAVPLTAVAAPTPASNAPMRPLPVASDRPPAAGPVLHVDPMRGDASGDGSEKRPWKTLEAATKHLKPGDTLYLHGGTYFESVTLALAGTA